MQHSQKKLIWRKTAVYDRLGIIFVCLLTLHQYSRLIYGTCNIQNIMNCQFNSFVSNVFIFEKKKPNVYIDQKVLQLNKTSFWKNLIFLSFLPLKTLYFITTNGDKSYLLTLPLCAGVSCVRALSPAWTGSPVRETLISRTHLFLPHDLPPTKYFSPDFEGPLRQLSKSSAREKNQVQ